MPLNFTNKVSKMLSWLAGGAAFVAVILLSFGYENRQQIGRTEVEDPEENIVIRNDRQSSAYYSEEDNIVSDTALSAEGVTP